MADFLFGFALGATYAARALFTYGATLAYFQRRWPMLANRHYRDDCLFAIFVAATPIGWIACAIEVWGRGCGIQYGRKAIGEGE